MKTDGKKCDGDHGGDECGDPECWQIDACDQVHGGEPCRDAHCYKKEAHAPRVAESWRTPLENADPDAYLYREA